MIRTSLFLFTMGAALGAPSSQVANPDFTKGEERPAGASHDWNLGPTGARGWMHSNKLTTSEARQILITKVDAGSPAEGVLEVGDVLLGVDAKPFPDDPRTVLGNAIGRAEAADGLLSLLRWRAGDTKTVVIKLPVLGGYSDTAPFDCAKSQRILSKGHRVLAERMEDPSYRGNPITRSLNALALLASGEKDYLPLVRREAQWAAEFSAEGFQTWWYGYTMIFLSEYVMATGDRSVLPGLQRLALEAAEGQSVVGSWGHRFAQEDGRLGGYGMMNSPGIPLTIGLLLASRAGVHDVKVREAVERSARLVRFYVGKGSVPYGDHHPWIQTHEDNGKNGMAAALFGLLGEGQAASYFSRMSLASHGAERDTGHTGNFFNILWSLPGVAWSGPHATGAWMEEFGGWYFDLARRWDGTFVHLGPPQVKDDKYADWDCTGAYLLAYAIPLGNLHLTGKAARRLPAVDATTAREMVADGRGWSNLDRDSHYDRLSGDSLLERLGSWSPVVRERAAMALARRKDAPIETLVRMLDSAKPEARIGACQALALQGRAAAPAVAALRNSLRRDDLWLRVKAAEALAGIGDPAMSAVPELLRMLASGSTDDDPRGMEQRYLCFTVFGKMLKRSLEGVDRDLLREAVAAGLRNEDGRARGSLGSVYQQLSYEEIKPLLPAIHEAIVTPAPSGIMFASGIRLAGLELLAKHRIREGIPLCLEVMEIDKWGKSGRISKCLKALGSYGAAAKPMLPQLRQLEKDLVAHREARNLQREIEQLRKLISDLEAAEGTVELRAIGNTSL